MSFLDAHGRTVPSRIALDTSGQLRAGFRRASEVVDDGEYISFALAFRDAQPAGTLFLNDAPFVSPAKARQAQIAAEVAGNAVARQTANDKHVSDAIAAVSAGRASGARPEFLNVMRDARYCSPAAAAIDAATVSLADNSHVASALRTARYL